MASSFQPDYLTTEHDLLNYFHDHNFNFNFNLNTLFEFEESLFSQEFDSSKRHKITYSDFNSGIPSHPKIEVSAKVSRDNNEMMTKKQSRGSLSAQSIAARERRRKITEKTQELGKLIPGGNKMNTAQMLTSAFDYVKFLQAQLLRFWDTNIEVKNMVASPRVEEILYSQKKCLVPTELLLTIAKDKAIQSNAFIVDQIHMLLGTDCYPQTRSSF